MGPRKLLQRLRDGHFTNVRFRDMRRLVEALGFELQRVSGSHHVFAHPDLQGFLNLQEVEGEAKPYQIRQLLRLVDRYSLNLRDQS